MAPAAERRSAGGRRRAIDLALEHYLRLLPGYLMRDVPDVDGRFGVDIGDAKLFCLRDLSGLVAGMALQLV